LKKKWQKYPTSCTSAAFDCVFLVTLVRETIPAMAKNPGLTADYRLATLIVSV
jgi:hypothetical protein